MFDRQFPSCAKLSWQPEASTSANQTFVLQVYAGPEATTQAPVVEVIPAQDEMTCDAELSDAAIEAWVDELAQSQPPSESGPVTPTEACLDVSLAKPAVEHPVIVGIDPEEVARREAEHYARGVTQGEQQAREVMAQEVTAQCVVLEKVAQELHSLLNDSARFFEPMKRLCLHLAEQITLAELRTPSHMIEQLIQRCLDALGHAAHGAVVVELHSQDLARLQQHGGDSLKALRLEAASDLSPGSVRLHVDDTVVEDLVQNRLQTLAQTLNINLEAWGEHSALLTAPLPTQDGGQHDVQHS